MTVRAKDNRSPERYSDSAINVGVTRNDHLPAYQGQPYDTDLSENTKVGGSVFTVIARDQDLQVVWVQSH